MDALIEDEMQTMNTPLETYLSHRPALDTKSTVFREQDMLRAFRSEPMDGIDTSRYELPAPPPDQQGNVDAWRTALVNAFAQLQHQANRLDNLDLMTRYGGQAWIRHNEDLAALKAAAERALTAARAEVDAINWERQSEQVRAGDELAQLETAWGQLVSKNYEVGLAVATLRAHVDAMQEAADAAAVVAVQKEEAGKEIGAGETGTGQKQQ